MAKSQNNVALAVTKNLLSYPSSTTFSRIIALTHRLRTVEDSGLPSDPRLELYSGIDLRATRFLGLEEVTQVYYLAYANATAYSENVMDIEDINVHMTSNALHASDQLCTNMKFFLLQTGTNNYGVAVFRYMDKISINPPLKEDQPRLRKQWKWCEVRPDQIISHVPAFTSMTYVEPIALYLSLYRYVNGPGARIPFPGTKKNFLYTYTDSSQDIITRAEIYLSVLEPEKANGEAFNIADTATPGPWSKKWLILASYFGLEGTGPNHAETGKEWGEIDKWWDEHLGEYAKMCEEYGLQERVIGEATWVFVKAGFMLLDRNREMSLDKIKSVGITEELPVGHGHYHAFDQMVLERIIPARDTWAKKQ
ncbi:hypothetical protein BDV19DRAFT_380816 [Aspergillus venezuelensis]